MKLRHLLLLAFGPLALLAAPSPEVVQAFLAKLQRETDSPGVSVAVSVRDKIVYSGGAGVSDLESGTPHDGKSVHNIGSVSKVIGTVALLQLVEQGRVDLDAELQTYVPWFPRKAQPITIRQLLTHTSGLRSYKDGEFGPDDVYSFRHYRTFEESTRYWRDDPLVFAPGSAWLYSSYGSSLLQAIIEQVSGLPLEQYLREHIWAPAGMRDTQLDVTGRIVPRRGRGYARAADGRAFVKARDEDVSYKYIGGGMITTDEDLCRFGAALNAGKLLAPATVAEMYRAQLRPDLPAYDDGQPKTFVPGPGQALTWRILRDPTGLVYYGHGGEVKGTKTRFMNYPEQGVVVAFHFNFGRAQVRTEELEAFARSFFPAPAVR